MVSATRTSPLPVAYQQRPKVPIDACDWTMCYTKVSQGRRLLGGGSQLRRVERADPVTIRPCWVLGSGGREAAGWQEGGRILLSDKLNCTLEVAWMLLSTK